MISVKKKIYLDSTVPNYVFNDAYSEKQKVAEFLFQNAKNKEVLMFASPNNLDDARHVAYAVYYSADIIASYNFSHIVRISTITQLQSVNLGLGFRTPEIRSPEELL